MTIQLFKEHFKDKYDGISPPTLLPTGSIVDGQNVRRVGNAGGWKTRKGATLHNTTAISAHEIKTLMYYNHPRNDDAHFLAHLNSKIYDMTNVPPTAGAGTGTDLGIATGTNSLFWDVVDEHLFIGDGSGVPITWGGNYPFCQGFVALFDLTPDVYTDYTRWVTDNRTDTYATVSNAVGDKFYVCSPERASGIRFTMGSTVNALRSCFTVKARRAGAWTEVTGLTNGTAINSGAVALEEASEAAACVITWVGHALKTGASVTIAGVTQANWTELNGTHVITKIDADTFSIPVDTTGNGDYIPGTDPGTILAVLGITLAQTGNLAWTASSSDTMHVIEGRMGYWYEITLSGALTAAVKITSIQVVFAMQRMTNKWSGVYEWVGAARFFDGTNYLDETGKVTNETTSLYMQLVSAGTSTYIYIKTPEPATGFGIGVDTDYKNATDSQVDKLEVWTGVAWTEASVFTSGAGDGTFDGTDTSFAQTGVLLWEATNIASAARRTFEWDSIPGYWYRISWDAATSEDVRIWGITYIPFPETLAFTDGCIEFKGRLFTWGDPEYPNRLRFSAKDKPDCFSGTDSGYTEQFGDKDKVLLVKRFYNELLIWKKGEVYLLEGYSPSTFGSLRVSDTVGIASPSSGQVIESGVPVMHRDEVLTVAIWQEVDGIYMLDGRKPKKISLPVDQFFNSEYSSCISAANIRNRQSFLDRLNNEYHFLLGDGELVYNYVRDEWYPKWDRYVELSCGLNFKSNDNRFYSYGANTTGFIFRLENGTAVDKDTANASQNIVSKIKSRAISATQKDSTTMRMTFRKLWLEAKQVTGGSVVTNFYPDLASSGTVLLTPTAFNLERTGYGLAIPELYDRKEQLDCFQIELVCTGYELEVYSMLYEIDILGEMFNVV